MWDFLKSLFGCQRRTWAHLDQLLDELATRPCRRVVDLQEGDDLALQWNGDIYAGDGLRWEKDQELRARIASRRA